MLAPFYKSRRDGLLKSQDYDKLALAFKDFFAKPPVKDQFDLLFTGQYALVTFDVLEDALAASCEWAGAKVPDGNLTQMLEAPLLALTALHPNDLAFRQKPLRGLPAMGKRTHV